MRWLASNVVGGFVRWGTATLIAAVCLIYGFSPAAWLAMVITDPPEVLNSPWLKFGAVIVGIIVFGGMIYWEVRRKRPSASHASESVALLEAQAKADRARQMLMKEERNRKPDIAAGSIDPAGQEQELNVAIWWVAESAWGRWQDAQFTAQSGRPRGEFSRMLGAITKIQHEIEIGTLSVRCLRRGAVKYEPLDRDLLTGVAALHIKSDPATLYRVFLIPRDGIDDLAKAQIPDYTSFRVKEASLKALWPQNDPALDAKTEALTAQAELKTGKIMPPTLDIAYPSTVTQGAGRSHSTIGERAQAQSKDTAKIVGSLTLVGIAVVVVSALIYFGAFSNKNTLAQYNQVDRNYIPVEQGYAECEYDALQASANGPHTFAADLATDRLITACMKRRGY